METNLPTYEPFSTRIRATYQKILLLALGLSIVLNIGLLFVIKRFVAYTPVTLRPLVATQEYHPSWLVTLAETPETARQEKPPANATHLSDKNAAAQNPVAPDNLPIGQPFSRGTLQDADSDPRPEMTPGQTTASAKPKKAVSDEVPARIEPVRPHDGISSNFRREFLTEKTATNQTAWPFASRFDPGRDNTTSRAPALGSFSLNTYAWEYAPYLLWLKNQIQRNIHPPPAFTHMGIISGRTVLRFRILKDGTLENLELLGYEGHKSLMETSVRAVQLSAPFRALPADFPENYLEITGQFEYIINR
ncbi:MAG: hypothetical protein ALAOOOJD_00056 [bacterium]|nr:hypothetical protein [bacterium]